MSKLPAQGSPSKSLEHLPSGFSAIAEGLAVASSSPPSLP